MMLSNIGSNQSVLSAASLQLLNDEKFYLNVTEVLNITKENLTNLLINVQNSNQELLLARTPPTLLTALTICYALIFAAGVLGNLITCIVISRNNFMHTATNFYLFNLAISDLILLVSGMPQDLYNLWQPDSYPFTDTICVVESVLCETAANTTVLTITAFTVERYIAICHPFRQHTMSKLSRAIKFIFAIWLTAFLLALPQAMQFSVMPYEGGLSCTMTNDFYAHVFAVSGFLFFGGPMTAICVLYVLIGVKLKRSRLLQTLPRRLFDLNRGVNAQSRVIRMLVAVAVAFFLCWAPFHAQRLMAVYGSTADIKSQTFNEIFNVLNYTSGVLYFLSTCINPLLYNIMSHKFREAFKVTLSRHFGLSGKYQTKNQHYNYSAMLRQNGSLRQHTTVNNRKFEHFESFGIVKFQCRDSRHHLSLQDSIRTTTTTTTVNSMAPGAGGNNSNNSRRSSQRNRCVSVGSQSALMASLSKNDVYAVNNTGNGRSSLVSATVLPQLVLQSQITQLSTVCDTKCKVFEAEIADQGTLNRPRPTIASRETLKRSDYSLSMHSCDAPESHSNANRIDENQQATSQTTMTRNAPLSSIAELNIMQPSRARLKMSQIVRHRDTDEIIANSSTRIELLCRNAAHHVANDANVAIHRSKRNAFTNLKDKFRWHKPQKVNEFSRYSHNPSSF